jgi:hypothetical protein
MKTDLVAELLDFMENEARSCSMDHGCITSLYVYRMWGGTIPIDKIDRVLNCLKTNNNGYR